MQDYYTKNKKRKQESDMMKKREYYQKNKAEKQEYYQKNKAVQKEYYQKNKAERQESYQINKEEKQKYYQKVKQGIKKNYNKKRAAQKEAIDVKNLLSSIIDTVPFNVEKEIQSCIHANPKVSEAIKKFEEGEQKHDFVTCNVCLETRPFFNESFENVDNSLVNIRNVFINKKGVCTKCVTDSRKRNKKNTRRPAKWSGYLSVESDLGPEKSLIRHNNMHFYPIPDVLKQLTTIELALISKITVCMRVHMLRYGMLSSKGHSVSVPQRMSIARQLPKLPQQVGIVVLKRKGQNQKSKHYTVKRKSVEDALNCLCYGIPNGGLDKAAPNTYLYTGPNHVHKQLNGKYFEHVPNPYYCDVEIMKERLETLPNERDEYPGLKTVYTEKEIPESEKGPAPDQFEVPLSESDESYTTSSITLPAEPKNISDEIKTIIEKLTGSKDIADSFALADWEYVDEEPLSELKTPGFFAQAFPTVFIGASCDLTHNSLVSLDLDEWISHIYYQRDSRVSNHPTLKFFLHNLSMRQKALNNGNYLVSQQLADSHISINELQERFANDDHSIPRRIIRFGSNLVNSDPYWNRRKRELDAFLFFRRHIVGDLPVYFHTNSMAELHWDPLKQLLAKYISKTESSTYEDVYRELNSNAHYLRQAILKNLHIVTTYFEARSINYYNTVAKELFNLTDYWFRFEFAKARGQIHSHGIIFSESHAKMVEDALDIDGSSSEEEKAKALLRWLQTTELDTQELFSPGFVSMHPAGGTLVNDNSCNQWVPNKEQWAKSEGSQTAPAEDPLSQYVTEYCNTPQELHSFYIYLVNRVALHLCNGYCLRKKRIDSETRYCRFHFGKEDPVTKKPNGKEIHPFDPMIEGKQHPRYEGPRDHPRMIMHVKAHILSWLANCDTQPLIDQDLLNLQKYITSYACKGAVATEDLIDIYSLLLDDSDPNSSLKSIVQKLLMKILGKIDTPAAAADFINVGGKLYHSTRHFQSVGLSGYRPISKKIDGDNLTQSIPLDRFLSKERRDKNPTISLYDWTKECNCRTKCCHDHVPVFTGVIINPVWPLSEEYCKTNLMIFSPGTWSKPEDLKSEDESFTEAFALFLDSEGCPPALQEIIKLAKLRHEKKIEKERRKESNEDNNSQTSEFDSQISSNFSQDSVLQEMCLGQSLLNEINNNQQHRMEETEEILFNGGENFDWHEYGITSLGFTWPDNIETWMKDTSDKVEEEMVKNFSKCDLPDINLLLANPIQRLIIALNLERLINIKKNPC